MKQGCCLPRKRCVPPEMCNAAGPERAGRRWRHATVRWTYPFRINSETPLLLLLGAQGMRERRTEREKIYSISLSRQSSRDPTRVNNQINVFYSLLALAEIFRAVRIHTCPRVPTNTLPTPSPVPCQTPPPPRFPYQRSHSLSLKVFPSQ